MTDQTVTVHSKRLIEGIARVKHAAATNPQRPVLNTIAIEGDDKGLRLIAADNYRIAIAEIDEQASDFGQALVWLRDVPLLLSVARATKGRLEFTRSDDRLTVSGGSLSLTVRLCDGAYADYRSEHLQWDAGDRQVLGVNPAFLGDVMRALGPHTGVARVYFGGPEQPVLVEAESGEFRSLIMPLRLPEVRAVA